MDFYSVNTIVHANLRVTALVAYNARFVLGLFIHDDERLSLLVSKEGRMIYLLFFE